MKITDIPLVKHMKIIENDDFLMLEPKLDVQNHLRSIHAAAQFALAESMSGHYLLSLFNEYTNRDVIPLLRSSTVKYKNQATSTLRAKAFISADQKEKFEKQFLKKGRAVISVNIELVDMNDLVTMTGEFMWFIQIK